MFRGEILLHHFREKKDLHNENSLFPQLLSGMSPEDFRQRFPYTDPGNNMYDPPNQGYINRLEVRGLPSFLTEKYVNSALFAEQGSFEGLEQYFKEKIRDMGDFYQYDESINKEVLRPIDVQKIFSIKRAMDQYMEGHTRRTGEPSVAHLYRVTLRVMDTFRALRDMNLSGGPATKVYTHHVENAIIGALMHDHIEDEYEKKEDGRVLRGGYQFRAGAPNAGDEGLIIYQYWQDSNAIKKDKDGNEIITEDDIIQTSKTGIPLDTYQYSTFDKTIRALNTNDLGSQTMQELLKKGMKKIEAHLRGDDYSIIMPLIIKFCDRQDNLATYFKHKDNGYVPAEASKQFEKWNETLNTFSDPEKTLEQAIQILRWKSGHTTDLLMKAIPQLHLESLLYPYFQAATTHPLRAIFPTTPARLLLLGYSQEEVFKRARYGAGTPRVI